MTDEQRFDLDALAGEWELFARISKSAERAVVWRRAAAQLRSQLAHAAGALQEWVTQTSDGSIISVTFDAGVTITAVTDNKGRTYTMRAEKRAAPGVARRQLQQENRNAKEKTSAVAEETGSHAAEVATQGAPEMAQTDSTDAGRDRGVHAHHSEGFGDSRAVTLGAARRQPDEPLNRTIVVATRLSEKTLVSTYLNALDETPPYIVTITLNEPPHTPVGGTVPEVGHTEVTVNDHGKPQQPVAPLGAAQYFCAECGWTAYACSHALTPVAPPGADLTNHHNALTCPYCNPDKLVLVAPGADLRPAGSNCAIGQHDQCSGFIVRQDFTGKCPCACHIQPGADLRAALEKIQAHISDAHTAWQELPPCDPQSNADNRIWEGLNKAQRGLAALLDAPPPDKEKL